MFVVHILMGIRLWRLNRRARPIGYYRDDTVQASWASRHMLLTGLVILAFVIYHLLHFTFGVIDPEHHKWVLPLYTGPEPGAQPESTWRRWWSAASRCGGSA